MSTPPFHTFILQVHGEKLQALIDLRIGALQGRLEELRKALVRREGREQEGREAVLLRDSDRARRLHEERKADPLEDPKHIQAQIQKTQYDLQERQWLREAIQTGSVYELTWNDLIFFGVVPDGRAYQALDGIRER